MACLLFGCMECLNGLRIEEKTFASLQRLPLTWMQLLRAVGQLSKAAHDILEAVAHNVLR